MFILGAVAGTGLALGLALAFGVFASTTETRATIEEASSLEAPLPTSDRGTLMHLFESQLTVGQPISFSIKPETQLGSGAWVGLVPSSVAHGSESVNDAADVDWVYVEAGHRYQLTASLPGRYDLRLHDRYPGGTEIESLTIEVNNCKCLCAH